MCDVFYIEEFAVGRFLRVVQYPEVDEIISNSTKEDLKECIYFAEAAHGLLAGLGFSSESFRAIRPNLQAAKDESLPQEERHDIIQEALGQIAQQLFWATGMRGEDGEAAVCPLDLVKALMCVLGYRVRKGRQQ